MRPLLIDASPIDLRRQTHPSATLIPSMIAPSLTPPIPMREAKRLVAEYALLRPGMQSHEITVTRLRESGR